MKSKRLRLVGGCLLGLALVATLAAYLVKARGAHALASYRKKLIAAGEKLKIDELLPPTLPPAENAAAALHIASSSWRTGAGLLDTNSPPAMKMVAPGKAMVGWAQPYMYDELVSNKWEEVQALVMTNQPGFDSLEQIVRLPHLDFQTDYRSAALGSITVAPLLEMRNAGRMSVFATLSDLHRGDMASASGHIRAILAMVSAASQERFPVSQLIRISITHSAAAATWEWLHAPGLNDSQMELMEKAWRELEFLRPTEMALAMERVISEERFELMRNSSATFRQEISAAGATPPAGGSWYDRLSSLTLLKTKESLWRAALSYPDQLRGLKGNQVLVDAVRLAAREGRFAGAMRQQDQQLIQLGINVRKENSEGWLTRVGDVDLGSLSESSVLACARLLERVYKAEVARQIVITAIALKRYELRHGSMPASLNDLVPDFLDKTPRDPMDGEPLRYRLKEDGTYLLYSIGNDGRDDGGNPSSDQNRTSFNWQFGRDLVWPQPATPAEIDSFFEKKRKR